MKRFIRVGEFNYNRTAISSRKNRVRRILTMLRRLLLVALVAAVSGPLRAQWYDYPSPGAPRTPAGKVDMAGATPRLANGKPDLSGVWMSAESTCGRVMGPTSVARLL